MKFLQETFPRVASRRLFLAAVAGLVAFVGVVVYWWTRPEGPPETSPRALGRLESAVRAAEADVRRRPWSLAALDQLARLRAMNLEEADALLSLLTLLRRQPDFRDAAYRAAWLCLYRGQLEVLPRVRQHTLDSRGQPTAVTHEVEALTARRKLEQLAVRARRWLRRLPDASLAERAGRAWRLRAFAGALRFLPASARELRADTRAALEADWEIASHCREAIRLDPTRPLPHLMEAAWQLAHGRPAEAAKASETVLGLAKARPEHRYRARLLRARADLSRGRLRRAASDFHWLLQADPVQFGVWAEQLRHGLAGPLRELAGVNLLASRATEAGPYLAGLAALGQGRSDWALNLFQAVASAGRSVSADGPTSTEWPTLDYAFAVALRAARSTERRRYHLRACLRAVPDFIPAHLLLAELDQERRRSAAALEHAQQVRRADPNNLAAFTIAIEAALAHQDYTVVRRELRRLIAASDSLLDRLRRRADRRLEARAADLTALLILGSIDFAQGRFAAARDRFHQALDVDATCLPAVLARADLWAVAGHHDPKKFDRAVELCRLAVDHAGEARLSTRDAYVTWVRVLLRAGRVREAAAESSKALETNVSSTELLKLQSQAAWRRGLVDEAMASIRRVVTPETKDLEVWQQVATVQRRVVAGSRAKLLELQQRLRTDPAPAVEIRFKIQTAEIDYEATLEALAQMLSKLPGVEAAYHQGLVLLLAGRSADGLELVRNGLRRHPSHRLLMAAREAAGVMQGPLPWEADLAAAGWRLLMATMFRSLGLPDGAFRHATTTPVLPGEYVKDWRDLLRSAARAAQPVPRRAVRRLILAALCAGEGWDRFAVTELRDLATGPNTSRLARLHYAAVLRRSGQEAAAQEQIDTIVREQPDYLLALALTAGTGRLKALNRVLAVAPDRWRVRLLRAEAALGEKRTDDAVADFRRVLRQAPSPRARLALARLNLAPTPEGDPIRNLRQLVQLQPKNAEAHRLLGARLLAAGRAAEALGPLQTALPFEPGEPEVHLLLAEAYAKAGRPDDAKAFAENLLLLWPEHSGAERARALAGR